MNAATLARFGRAAEARDQARVALSVATVVDDGRGRRDDGARCKR